MNVSDDFDRFDKIFGITSSAMIKKAPTTAPPKSRKRRSLPNNSNTKFNCGPQLPIKRIRGNFKKEVVSESPDKSDILANLSCHAADFHKSLISNSDDSDSEDEKKAIRKKLIQALKEEAYSPDIEEFSESEDIFHISQESNNIAIINNEIVEINQKKPKYRPYKKPPLKGGLLQKLIMMKNRRKALATSFVIGNRDHPEQRKIQVIEHSKVCKSHLVSFKFIDKLIIDENRNFMVVPSEYSKFVTKHLTYDVVFKSAEKEIHPKHFMHFVKFIKAARKF